MAAYAAGRDAEAEGHLRELVVTAPSNLAAHLRLGKMLQETGRHDEATEIFERAIAIEPYESRAYHGMVTSKRMAESDRPLLARLLSRLDTRELGLRFSPAAAENHEMWLHFAAGKARSDLGEYAVAMDHFRAANRIRRRRSEPNFLNVDDVTSRIVARYGADFFREHEGMGDPDETPIGIIGMPRSGTTLLERIVSSHPKVIGCGEVAYWSEQGPKWAFADPALLQENADKLRNDYLLRLRRGESGSVRSIDKMPNFLWVGLAHVLFPNARFIHCRRNPLDTCLSIYATPMGKSWEFAGDLNDLATCYELYRRLMDHWRRVIPPDRFLDVDYEEVVRDPEPWARRLIDFCGLPWDAACLRPEDNPAAVKTASHWQVRQRIHGGAVERWRRYEPWLDELKRLH
jgi:tetratricopeptide (TPR) repeat protein